MQSPFPLGLNDNIYHEGNISKIPNFDIFLFWNAKHVKVGLMLSEKSHYLAQHLYRKTHKCFVLRISIALNNHGLCMAYFLFLSFLPFSVLRNLKLEAYKLYDRAINLYKATLLTRYH